MNLTELTRQVGALRGMPAAAAAGIVASIIDDLTDVAHDDRIDDDTAAGLLTRALRAIHPHTERPAHRHAALDALRIALADGPRPQGRPAKGPARTVRAAEDVWAEVDEYAAVWGVSQSDAAAELIVRGLSGLAPDA